MSRRRLIRSIASNWVRMVWGIVWGIVMVPIFVTYLGRSEYGIWILIHAVVGYYGLLDLGVHPATMRHIARCLGGGDRDGVNETFNSALIVQAALGLAAMTVSVLLAVLLPRWEGFAANAHPQVSALLLLIGASVALSFVGSSFRGALNGAERFDLTNVIRMASSLAMNLGFIAVLTSGGGLVGLAWVHLLVTLLEKPVMAVVALRFVPGLQLAPRMFRRARVREIFGYGLHAFVVNAGERLRFFTDAVVIGAFLPAESITIFRIGNRPLQFLTNFVRGISRVMTPAFSRTEAAGSGAGVARLLLLGTRATALLATLGCLLLAVTGDRLLQLWLGEGFHESWKILMVLAPAYLIETSLAPTGSALLGTTRFKVLSRISILEGLANLGLSLWLIQPLGLMGVALGTSLPMVVTRLFVIPLFACRHAGLGVVHFMVRTWAPVLPPLAGGAAASLALTRWLPGGDLTSVGATIAAISAVYGLLALLVLWLRNDELLPPQLSRFLPRSAPET